MTFKSKQDVINLPGTCFANRLRVFLLAEIEGVSFVLFSIGDATEVNVVWKEMCYKH